MKTKRTFLRRFLGSDFDSLRLMLADIEVMKLTGFKDILSEERSRELLEEWIKDEEVWAAIDDKDGVLLGWFMMKKRELMNFEIGFMLNKDYWNKGYATEISLKLIEYTKRKYVDSKIIASTNIENMASIKVLEKIGMKRSQNHLLKNNIIIFEL